jgi:hypothetical protein
MSLRAPEKSRGAFCFARFKAKLRSKTRNKEKEEWTHAKITLKCSNINGYMIKYQVHVVNCLVHVVN